MTTQPEEYLAILKASYDYDPQSDDEIAIKENQLLFLLERVDSDWWKVKVKAGSQEEEGPSGLVPAAYVEQADHVSTVKALYDYEAASPGEVSVQEDEVLLVFETDQDWLLVQSQKEGGRAGYVPGNYVEAVADGDSETQTEQVIVPPSPPQPPRPSSTYMDPADRVAASKLSADTVKTWPVSELDKKGKKKKGTLGIGNGSLFFASESDKNPVQKWQSSDIQNISSEKSKHVTIEIGGAIPTSLHFQANSKDTIEEIISKLKSSKALASSETESKATAITSSPRKPSVHFSHEDPVIIPRGDEEEEAEETEDVSASASQASAPIAGDGEELGTALYDFTADGDDELSVSEGEQLVIIEKDGDEWWKCRNAKGQEGVVPASYLEISAPLNVQEEAISEPYVESLEKERRAAEVKAEAERLQREQEERAEMKRQQEAQRARDAAIAAEIEQKRKSVSGSLASTSSRSSKGSNSKKSQSYSSSRASSEIKRPPPDQVRTWHDRTGQFQVDAAFVGFSNGKLRLHKVNGVTVEVPSEKMSIEDMKYVEKLISKSHRPQPSKAASDDDVPLGLTRHAANANGQPPSPSSRPTPQKKQSKIDWFDFFLSAGCDLDDCTRYAASFEKDKIDEFILPDITESTMRSLGLREGDIIRVKKAIAKRQPTDNLVKPDSRIQEQMHQDEELARQLQAQENGGSVRSLAPNLFAGPGGVLKNPRRGRPQSSKTLPPPSVDINAISTASEQISRSTTPQVSTPNATQSPVQLPPRSNSAAPVISGFEDDAWTNRPSSAKPTIDTTTVTRQSPAPHPAPAPASSAPLAPAPSAASTSVPATPPAASSSALPAVSSAMPSAPSLSNPSAPASNSLANTTESDIFDQLSRLSELRKAMTPSQPAVAPPSALNPTSFTPTPPSAYQPTTAAAPSPASNLMASQVTPQFSVAPPAPPLQNGPRGPFAPVPANQALLQPLIPTQTGFNSFIPTRSTLAPSPFQTPPPQPTFLASQPTGLPSTQPMVTQPTGLPFGSFGPAPFQAQPPNGMNSSPFNAIPPAITQSPASNATVQSTSPANVFAQMKSGTFANEESTGAQPLQKYDALRQFQLTSQPTGWQQPYQSGYMGYRG